MNDWIINFPYNVRNKKLRNAIWCVLGAANVAIFMWIIIEGVRQI